jgi:glycosyltransferase involved in cell wall biosynthesis
MDGMNLLLLATEDWYVASHRLPVIRAATAAGFAVTVATRVRDHGDPIRAAGADLVSLEVDRGGMNPLADLASLRHMDRIYRDRAPDLVHHVGMKPILYGGLVARRRARLATIHAFAGLGAVVTATGVRSAARRAVIVPALRAVTRRERAVVLVQNDDDAAWVRDHRLARPDAVRVIRGSGVDLARFVATPLPDGPPIVLLPARLLGDKGVREFVVAAARLRGRARFVLAGDIDPANPSSCSSVELRRWVTDGAVEWWGHQNDMPATLAAATLVVLPSYREGMPKALLEAAAAGRPVVTTDVPGCRDVVRQGDTGLLVPPRDAGALADGIGQALDNPLRLAQFGQRARQRAEAEFDDRVIAAQQVALYREVTR